MKKILLLLFALTSSPTLAHDVMGTVFYLELGTDKVHMEVEMPVDELRLALGQASEPGLADLPATGSAIAAYLLQHLSLTTVTGVPFALQATAGEVMLHDQRNWQKIAVEAMPPKGGDPRDFILKTDVINHQVVSHHIFLFLRRDFANGHLAEPVYLDTLHYQIHESHIKREAGSLGVGLWSVFRLGMSHIAEGTDHLLFLFTLLLPASLIVAGRRRWGKRRNARDAALGIIRIVTAFTIGHSLTLLLGALGWVRVPSTLVESFIALSVLISAIHAIVPIFPRKEAWVALSFGLIHGLGFASALEGIGADGWTMLLTIFGFNLGVETMQILLVLVTLPVVFLLQGSRFGPRFRQCSGAMAAVMAIVWVVQRAG